MSRSEHWCSGHLIAARGKRPLGGDYCTIAAVLAEILTIGDELCRGEIVDTNAAWLAEKLWDLDITVRWMTSCRDDAADMRRAFGDAVGRADVVLCSGGLGPTEDDLTVDLVAEMLGVDAVIDEPARLAMEQRFSGARMQATPNSIRQVRLPRGARGFANPAGLAPGFEVMMRGCPVICLPGVPREVYAIFETGAAARLIELRDARGERVERIARRTWRVFGRGESQIATAASGVIDGVAGASIHYQVKFPETLVKVVVRDSDGAAALARLESVDRALRTRLAPYLYSTGSDGLPEVVGRALAAAHATLATAESCTGGLIAQLVTSAPGSSTYFVGGAVTYADREKVRQLDVREATLAAEGAVSEACVREMAEGARQRFAVDYAVAASGIAGPGGASAAKPVGTVWIAVADPDRAGGTRLATKLIHWPGARDQIRMLAAYWGLALLLRAVQGDSE